MALAFRPQPKSATLSIFREAGKLGKSPLGRLTQIFSPSLSATQEHWGGGRERESVCVFPQPWQGGGLLKALGNERNPPKSLVAITNN